MQWQLNVGVELEHANSWYYSVIAMPNPLLQNAIRLYD